MRKWLTRTVGFLTVETDNPALLVSQYRAFSRQMPLMYFLLLSSSWALAIPHFGVAPVWLSVVVPLLLSAIACWRVWNWWRSRDIDPTPEIASRALRRTNRLSIIIAVAFSAWSLSLFPYGGAYGQSHVAFYMAITVIACIFSLMYLRSAALWVSAVIESRLLRSAVGDQLSLRKALSNATRALLMFVGLMLALSAVGIDLTALSVLGGAVGVGIGFGLQKLAANYVSGFVILAERSMRIGDNVRVDNFEGRITDINARYTVIRALNGRESIVPNEMLIINRVENLSLADSRVWQSTVVSVAYDSDVEQVTRLLLDAASSPTRVLKDPAPSVAMTAFGADGLEFTVGYWIADPENGQNNLKSEINHAILRSFRAHGIEIPFPQRVMHVVNPAPPPPIAPV